MEMCADSTVDRGMVKIKSEVEEVPWSSINEISGVNEYSHFYNNSADSGNNFHGEMAFHIYKHRTHFKEEYGGVYDTGAQHGALTMQGTSQPHGNFDIHNNLSQAKCDTCGKLYAISQLHISPQGGVSKYYCYDCVDKLTEDFLKPCEKLPYAFSNQQCTSCAKPCSYNNSCEICIKKQSGASAENTSSSTNVKKRERMFECDICFKDFTQLAHLKTHKLIHTGEKSFQCDICYKKFTRKSGLDVHKLIHTGEKSYKCEICFAKFLQPSHLKTHKLIHTGERSFECDICYKKFSRKSGLDVHKLTHTGEKPYECEMCLKRFIQPSHLNTHKLVHSGEKPFVCNICFKRYNRSALLRKHQLTHNKEDFPTN